MANPNATPFMGETEDDDSSESPRSYNNSGNFLMNAAARAEQQAAEQQRREEQQREIFKALGLESTEDDEDDSPLGFKKEKIPAEKEEDSSKAEAAVEEPDQAAPVSPESQQLESEIAQAAGAEQPVEEAVTENKVEPDGELRIEHDPELRPEEPASVPEYEMASEEAEQPPATEAYSEASAREEVPIEAPAEDIEPVLAAETAPPAETIQAASMSEESPPASAETLDGSPPSNAEQTKSPDMDSPPPPPEEPPTSNESGDRLPPPPASSTDMEELPPEVPDPAEIQQRHETVVERHSGGVGAALMAFFAANWLGRRRDRKIRREVKALDKELEEARERTEAERRYVRASERKTGLQSQEQQAKIARLERAQAVERAGDVTIAGENETEAKTGPVPLGEVLAATGFAQSRSESQSKQAAEVPETISSEHPESQPHEEYVYQTKQEQLLKNREQQREEMLEPVQDIGQGGESVREIVLERRKEAKSDPSPTATPSGFTGAGSSTHPSSSKNSGGLLPEDRPGGQEAEDDLYAVSLPEPVLPENLYKQSLVTGAAVGLAVVVLGAVVYFLMF